MLEKRHQVPFRGNTRITDPARRGGVEHPASGEFEAEALAHIVNDGDAVAVRPPIRILDILQDRPWRRAGRRARQRTWSYMSRNLRPVGDQQPFARFRDSLDIGVTDTGTYGPPTARTRGIKFHRIPVPIRPV